MLIFIDFVLYQYLFVEREKERKKNVKRKSFFLFFIRIDCC